MNHTSRPRVIVMGAGISGLSCAYFLSTFCDVVVLEKNRRAGGWLQTNKESKFLFEKGPRTFRSTSQELLQLTRELHLENEIIYADKKARGRYLFVKNQLKKWPFPFLSLAPLKSLIKDLKLSTEPTKEETIWEFATRHFHPDVAETIFDPMTLGVYAGDIRKLSMQACFPFFIEMEKSHKSLLKALLAKSFKKKRGNSSSLFSFKNGVNSLVDALQNTLKDHLYLNQLIQKIHFSEEGVEVETLDGRWKGDYLISALPPKAIGELFASIDHSTSMSLKTIDMIDLTVVNVGYHKDVLAKKGFGYLVPTREKQEILGVVFDSQIFPQQNRHGNETRLTVLMRGKQNGETALLALKNHLKIEEKPLEVQVFHAADAIPQFYVGHQQKMREMQAHLERFYPRFKCIGNFLSGASVNDCVRFSQKCALQLKEKMFATL